MKTDNSKVSHYNAEFWGDFSNNVFKLADSLGSQYIASRQRNSTQVVYQTPTVDQGLDTSRLLMWGAIGLAVIILAVVLIVIFKK
jgi:hypothetical protein